jgi:hypothetical protein
MWPEPGALCSNTLAVNRLFITPTLHHPLYIYALSLSTHPRTHRYAIYEATFILFFQERKQAKRHRPLRTQNITLKDQQDLLQMQETTSRKVTDKPTFY